VGGDKRRCAPQGPSSKERKKETPGGGKHSKKKDSNTSKTGTLCRRGLRVEETKGERGARGAKKKKRGHSHDIEEGNLFY